MIAKNRIKKSFIIPATALGLCAVIAVVIFLFAPSFNKLKISQKNKKQEASGTVQSFAVPTPTLTYKNIPRPDGYFMYDEIFLNKNNSMIDGRLELWLDKRIFGRENPGRKNDHEDESYNSYFKEAKIVLYDSNGTTADTFVTGNPYTNIREVERAYPDGRSLFKMVFDNWVGHGVYSGDDSDYFIVDNKITTLNVHTTNALAMGSKIVAARSGKGKDILYVHRHPGEVDGTENLWSYTYTRYFYNGTEWESVKKDAVAEFWENEDAESFPEETLFP